MPSSSDETPTPPRRSRAAMWAALVFISVAVAVAVTVGARQAAGVLAAVMAVFAVIRGITPPPGPYGISTRSKVFDVTVLVLGAVTIGLLALLATNIDDVS